MCESCTKPLSDVNRGTSADGGVSELYCESCYQRGLFVNDMTLDEMRSHVAQVLQDKGIPSLVRKRIVANVGNLERWRAV